MPQENWQPLQSSPYASQTPPNSPSSQVPPTPAPNPLIPRPPFPSEAALSSHYIKPKRYWLLPTLIALIILLIGGGAGFLIHAYRNNPSVIFNAALAHSLNTQQVKENITSGSTTDVITFDVHNPGDSRISSLTTKSLGANTYVKGYGSLQNTYINYASDPTHNTNTPTAILDQWVSVRRGGILPANVSESPLLENSDPRSQLLGNWIFGGFSSKNRTALLNTAKNAKLFTVDTKTVSHTTMSGQPAIMYTFSVNGAALAKYEDAAGVLFSLSKADVATATQGLAGKTITMKVYVQTNTHEVVRVDTALNGLTTSASYSDFNTASLPSEPHADLTYSEYLTKLGS